MMDAVITCIYDFDLFRMFVVEEWCCTLLWALPQNLIMQKREMHCMVSVLFSFTLNVFFLCFDLSYSIAW